MLSKRQRREQKKKLQKKIEHEVERLKQADLIKEQAKTIYDQQKSLPPTLLNPNNKMEPSVVINYIADRNGCGYYRCIWPFELLATYKNIMSINSFIYHTELSSLQKIKVFRFQRQATDAQTMAWNSYLNARNQHNLKFKMQYEIDDLLMEIEPYNTIAYEYYDAKKKQNHLHMLRTADSITFSTEALKDIYVKDYKIDSSKIFVIKNNLPQFLYSLPYRSSVKEFDKSKKEKRPRILWSGSASHVGKGGDLDFIYPMIEKTVDEYNWVFQGVCPPNLTNYVKEGKIEFIPWVPTYGLANMQFYKARPDICIAPLKPSRFNSVKSDLKYLESSSLGSPCITTSFASINMKSPYDISNAEICIEPDADTWKTMIDHLTSNPDYYMQTIKKQYEFLNSRWMENNLDLWENAIK